MSREEKERIIAKDRKSHVTLGISKAVGST
jgi:hypothetical protein